MNSGLTREWIDEMAKHGSHGSGDSEQYEGEEAKARFEAALRGARITGHKPMTDIPKKRVVKKTKPRKKPGK
jgi:hypothetical protein